MRYFAHYNRKKFLCDFDFFLLFSIRLVLSFIYLFFFQSFVTIYLHVDKNDDDEKEFLPVKIIDAANLRFLNLLSSKFKQLCTKRYKKISYIMVVSIIITRLYSSKDLCHIVEIKKYFAKTVFSFFFLLSPFKIYYCLSTLWAYFSTFKACAQINDNIADVLKYNKFIYLIEQNTIDTEQRNHKQ